jgi:poly-beta-1,6-N-acetyl-D-glucosamine synthase
MIPMPLPTYVVITPARNESEFMELALRSMVQQIAPPLRWVIVSDGSTDGTDEIVERYTAKYSWIELIHIPERSERDFAAKVNAFNAGFQRVRDLDYDVIACMDADISFDTDYFIYLLQKLADDSSLGVVGTPFQELDNQLYDYRFVSIEHVSGACQVFRRECFDAIGGYIPIRGGSVDHVAVLTARMRGWKTRTFTDKVCVHHRTVGTAQAGSTRAKFRYGMKDYAIGNSVLWELFRSLYQMSKPPVFLGGLAVAAGYLWAWSRNRERPVSQELVAFHRREQMRRLRRLFFRDEVTSDRRMPARPAS